MKIPKSLAVELIVTKISEFKRLLQSGNYYEKYFSVYYATEVLLTELFSQEEAERFKEIVAPLDLGKGTGRKKEVYQRHIRKCIGQLEAYKYRIENFLDTDEIETKSRRTSLLFISMSFTEEDRDVNDYFMGILNALQIEFETGKRYSWASVPEKVKSKIRNCDLMIGIFTKRDETKDGKYKTAEWLVKELGIAGGAGKNVIALVEKDVEDIAGLKYEKEVIYFERNSVKEMWKATVKFLEALREHGLV